MRGRTVAGSLGVGGMVGALAMAFAPAAGAQPEAIRIGGGFSLTGGETALGVPAANGARLAVEELNATGGVGGVPIEHAVRDSRYDMAVTAEEAQRSIEEDRVQAFIGYADTDSVLAAGPIFQAAGIPFITVGATSPLLPSQVGDRLFLAAFGDNVQAAAGAEHALATYGDTAYLLSDSEVEYTRLLGGYFRDAFGSGGGTVVGEDTYEGSLSDDVSVQVGRLLALPTPPAFLYLAAMPSDVGPLIVQLREAGFDGPIVGGDGYDTPELLAVAGDAAEGVVFTTHALMDPVDGTPRVQAFMAAYEARFGRAAENAFAALGYDTMRLMADAIGRAGSTDGAAITAALGSTVDFPGVTGSISFTADQRVPQKGVTIIAIEDGAFTFVAEVVPRSIPAP